MPIVLLVSVSFKVVPAKVVPVTVPPLKVTPPTVEPSAAFKTPVLEIPYSVEPIFKELTVVSPEPLTAKPALAKALLALPMVACVVPVPIFKPLDTSPVTSTPSRLVKLVIAWSAKPIPSILPCVKSTPWIVNAFDVPSEFVNVAPSNLNLPTVPVVAVTASAVMPVSLIFVLPTFNCFVVPVKSRPFVPAVKPIAEVPEPKVKEPAAVILPLVSTANLLFVKAMPVF